MPGTPRALRDLLEARARKTPAGVAVSCDDKHLTYGELDRLSSRLAGGLAELGLRKGDRVALLLPNVPAYVIASYALAELGAVVVNLSVGAHDEELRRALLHSEARAAITLDIFQRRLLEASLGGPLEVVILQRVSGDRPRQVASSPSPELLALDELIARSSGASAPLGEVCGDDLAVLQYTSGTTGRPKAVMLSHGNLLANVLQIEAALPHEDFGNGAAICVVPFSQVFGLTVCLHLSVRRGYRMVCLPRFDWASPLALIELLERYRPVSFPAVPPLWAALLAHPGAEALPLSSIRIASAGGAPLPAAVQEHFHELTGRWILEAYGLSEASSTTHLAVVDGEVSPGGVGFPLEGTEARIIDIETSRGCAAGEVGELLVRGPQVMQGYWRSPELTEAALQGRWLRTGDLARMDERGRTFIVGRRDDLIISRGYNIAPAELEAIIGEHEAVAEVAVVGVPDRIRGEAVVAVVVARDEATYDEASLWDHCRAHLPEHQRPRVILRRERLPRDPTGQLQRRALSREVAERR